MAETKFLTYGSARNASTSTANVSLLQPSGSTPPNSVIVQVSDGEASLAAYRAQRRRRQSLVLFAILGSILWVTFIGFFSANTKSHKPLYFALAISPFLLVTFYGIFRSQSRTISLRDRLTSNRNLDPIEAACVGPLDRVEVATANWDTAGKPPLQDIGLVGFHDDTTTVQVEGLRFRMLIRQEDVRRFHELHQGDPEDWGQFSLELAIDGQPFEFSLRCRDLGSIRSWLDREHRDPSHEYVQAARNKRLSRLD